MGKLYFYYGTMGAAKSMELILCQYRYENIGKKVLVLKSDKATRDGELIKSRTGLYTTCHYLEPYLAKTSIDDIINNYDIILIDEVQFCSENTINKLADITDKYDIPIICYGLKTDLRTHLFTGSKRLLEIADKCVEIKNICDCGNKALFSIKINGDDDINGEYKACCRICAKKYLKY